ncbi:MAG: peptidase [Dactylosporangium sp.]|nr:peptidase [Dactylosporangium sp.]NNJ60516.1 peptidase [Dactylosporangium sp.]
MATGIALLITTPAQAAPSPSPSASGDIVTKAGTSFLTATAVKPAQPVRLTASTGDYLYWSVETEAGQTAEVAATVTLPAADARHGAQTWTVEVFDGLRRRQACTAGAQAPTASATDPSVALDCSLREVRAWAEPWSGDPLPGTYYIRLSAIDLPEQDLGLTIQVSMQITVADNGDPVPEGGDLQAPLVPAGRPGSVLTSASPSPSASPADGGIDWGGIDWGGWLPDASTRWIWTTAGGVLAAVAGVAGFALTRRSRRWQVR